MPDDEETPRGDAVVLVDDDEATRSLLGRAFGADGWSVLAGATGDEGLELAARVRPAAVLVEATLRGLGGLEVCRRLRADPAHDLLAVVVMSARAGEPDRARAFEAGADAYVEKPLRVREVLARTRALVAAGTRRTVSPEPLRWRGVEIDPLRHRVSADGVELTLRPIEYRILLLVLSHPGRTFTRAEVFAAVGGDAGAGRARVLDSHLSRLRAALGPYASSIETVQGLGLRLGTP